MKKYKIKKLPNGQYKVEETLLAPKETSVVDKSTLIKTIAKLENELARKQAKLDLRKELLIEINKINI